MTPAELQLALDAYLEQSDPDRSLRKPFAETIFSALEADSSLWWSHPSSIAKVLVDFAQFAGGEAAFTRMRVSCEEALAMRAGMPRTLRGLLYSALANACWRLGEFGSDNHSLRDAIIAAERATALIDRTTEPAAWGRARAHRAVSFWLLGARHSDVASLQQAVDTFVEAISALDAGQAAIDWAKAQDNRASAFRSLAKISDRKENLTAAIACYAAALTVWNRHSTPLEWARSQETRAEVLMSLGELVGDTNFLREAVAGFDAAIKFRSRSGSPTAWANSQIGRANALFELGRLVGNIDALRDSVAGYEAVLEIWTQSNEPVKWAMTQVNRGSPLTTLGEKFGDAIALRKAVAGFDCAFKVLTLENDPMIWALTKVNRAAALTALGFLTGDSKAFSDAIASFDAALEVRDRDAMPTEWANTNTGKAIALHLLGNLEKDIQRLEESLACFDAALEVQNRHVKQVTWASTQSSRASVLGSQGDILDDIGLLSDAVAGFEAALEIQTAEATPVDWARTHQNRAFALLRLGELEQNTDKLKSAVRGFDAALKIQQASKGSNSYNIAEVNRANAIQKMAELLGDTDLLHKSLQDFREIFLKLQKTDNNWETFRVGLRLSGLLIESGDLSAALTCIDQCLALSDAAIADASKSAAGRIEVVHQVSAMHGKKVICMLQIKGAGAALKAILAAEAGRARLARYAMQIEVPEGIDAYVALAAAVPEGGAIVLPVITSSESLAFVISRDGPPTIVELPGLTEATLQARFNDDAGWIAAQKAADKAARDRSFYRGGPAHAAWNDQIDAQATWLHAHLLGPVEAVLIDAGFRPADGDHPGDPVVLLPTGLLGLLPLGAARAATEDIAFCERWSLTFAPSAAMLAVCRHRAAARRSFAFLGLYHPTDELRGAAAEANFAQAYFEDLPDDQMRLLRDRDATLEAALAGASEVSHLQLSCHGVHDPVVPERSGLELFLEGGEDLPEYERRDRRRLQLADLQKTKLSARLVIMSACESAVAGVRRAPEEHVGLPTGVLAAGAAAAIGTLWSVADDTAAVFTTLFLTRHLNPDGSERQPPAEAFRDTQRFLCQATRDEIAGVMAAGNGASRKRPEHRTDVSPIPTAPFVDHPFSNPSDWAAFTYTGA